MDFSKRHIGPDDSDINKMLSYLGFDSIEQLINATIPDGIQFNDDLNIGKSISEYEFLNTIKRIGKKNQVVKSYIGTGYYGTVTPPVILRNILENPGWYTAYTPYQAEISQGRLEALLNFQTMVTDMTGLDISNASLLDESTAAAEAMVLMFRSSRNRNTFLVSDQCHPQTIDVLKTRSRPIDINLKVIATEEFVFNEETFGCLIQCPTTDGKVFSYKELAKSAHDSGAYIAVATDLLSLALIAEPGSYDADIAIGSTQRFGVPLGFGGPHAAFLAAKENFKRKMPGRIIGLSKDADDNLAFRMALQTREQHIRRDKATSNICTAQVLLSVIAGMYAVYHGPDGIHQIAKTVHDKTKNLASSLKENGFDIKHDQFFDTIRFGVNGKNINFEQLKANLRTYENGDIGISIDETTSQNDINEVLKLEKRHFGALSGQGLSLIHI